MFPELRALRFIASRGYRAVEKAVKTMTPDDVVEEVKKIWFTWTWWSRFPDGNEMELFG